MLAELFLDGAGLLYPSAGTVPSAALLLSLLLCPLPTPLISPADPLPHGVFEEVSFRRLQKALVFLLGGTGRESAGRSTSDTPRGSSDAQGGFLFLSGGDDAGRD